MDGLRLSARAERDLARLRVLVARYRDRPGTTDERKARLEWHILVCFLRLPPGRRRIIVGRMYHWRAVAALPHMGKLWQSMGWLNRQIGDERCSRMVRALPGGEWQCRSCGTPMRVCGLKESEPKCEACRKAGRTPGLDFDMTRSTAPLFGRRYGHVR